MRKTFTAALSAAALAATAIAGASSAFADDDFDVFGLNITPTPNSDSERAIYDVTPFSGFENHPCADVQYFVFSADLAPDSTIPESIIPLADEQVLQQHGPVAATLDLTDLGGGHYRPFATCDGGMPSEETYVESESVIFVTASVTKTVSGEVPTDATFEITLTCEISPQGAPAATERVFVLDFPATGGTKYVKLLDSFAADGIVGYQCEVVETETGGAIATEITNETFGFETTDDDDQNSVDFDTAFRAGAEVHNVFPTNEIEDTEEPEGTEDDGGTDGNGSDESANESEEELQQGGASDNPNAAKPVTVQPTYEG